MASMTVRLERDKHGWGIFDVLRRRRTYLNLLYLLLAFPIGSLYLIGFGNLWWRIVGSVSIVGAPIFVLACAWPLAIFERTLAHGLLGVSFTPIAPPLPSEVSLWERIKAHIRNPVTWKSFAYLILREPFGMFASLISAALLLAALALLFAPLFYIVTMTLDWSRIGAFLDEHGYWFGSWFSSIGTLVTRQFGPQTRIELHTLGLSLLAVPFGMVALAIVLHALNGLAAGWGWFARMTLGVNMKDVQLAEARADARAARTRAEQAEQGRRQLIVDASHELRTPIATIRAHIDSLLLLEGERLPSAVRSYLAVTQREAERLGTLVDDLLMLARADANELSVELRPVALDEVVEEVFRALEPLAEHERQVMLVRTVAADLPSAVADRDRLAQVLLNLVRNAIMYTPPGGIVSLDVAAGAQPGTLAIIVSDTGVGIPDDELEHVFERFYRTDASRGRDTGGFGLGLSIVRDLVGAMGGTVVAERVPAGGARFCVTLRTAVATPMR